MSVLVLTVVVLRMLLNLIAEGKRLSRAERSAEMEHLIHFSQKVTSYTVPPSRRHSSGGRRRVSAELVRWSHQALRAASIFARGKAVREFFNLGIITTVLPSLNPIQLFRE